MKSIRPTLVFPALFVIALASVARASESVWTSHGPAGGGLVNDVAVSDAVAYVATPNGVFRSTDGARTWQPSGLAGENISRILARPGATVVLAITTSQSLYASPDAGETWARILGLPAVSTAAIDPWHLSTIYAGAGDGIWKSTDAGATFQRHSTTPTGFAALAFAFDSRALYLQSFDLLETFPIYKSTDGGASWAIVPTPISRASALAAGAADGVVYVGTFGSLCRSADSTATWTCRSFPNYPTAVVELAGSAPGAVPRVLTVSENTSSENLVYVSDDGGATWARLSALLEQGPVSYFPTLASDASGSLLLAGSSTGVFRSQDRGDTWTLGKEGLRSSIIASLVLDPNDSSRVWASALELGLFRSTDAGLSWSSASGPAEALSLGALAIDLQHSSTLYVATESGVSRSDDDGALWTSSALPDATAPNALAVDPDLPARVWAASNGGLFRSDDGARSWEPASISQAVYCILFDKRDTVYAGADFGVTPADFSYPEYPYGGSIFASRDGGTSFTKLDKDFGSAVSAIAVDPFQDGGLYVGTYTGNVFRSADGGTTWDSSGLDGPVSSLVADPVRPGTLYAAIGGGVYRTVDGARSWLQLPSGLEFLRAQSLVISPDGKWLHAGTAGGGIFELDLDSDASTTGCVPSASRLCLVGGRYAVDLIAKPTNGNLWSPGSARPLGGRSGYFSLPFATGDPDLPEVVVKMLADGALGSSGAPVFYSSLTTLPFSLTVTDTTTGQQKAYASKPDAPLCGGVDIPQRASSVAIARRAAPKDGETELQLLGGRFSITLEARRPGSGDTVGGMAMASGDRFGFFSLPAITGDPQFPEVAVKMLDATAIAGDFWVFYTGLTSLDYTLTVKDSVTGRVNVYESATPFCGAADTQAFTNSPWDYAQPFANGSLR